MSTSQTGGPVFNVSWKNMYTRISAKNRVCSILPEAPGAAVHTALLFKEIDQT